MNKLDDIIFNIELSDVIKFWNKEFGYTGENPTKIQFKIGKLCWHFLLNKNAPAETLDLIKIYIDSYPEMFVQNFNPMIKQGIEQAHVERIDRLFAFIQFILPKIENNPALMREVIDAVILRLRKQIKTSKTFEINNIDYFAVNTLIAIFEICVSTLIQNPMYKLNDSYSMVFKSRSFGEDAWHIESIWTTICKDVLFDKDLKNALSYYSNAIKHPEGFDNSNKLWQDLIKCSEYVYQNLPVDFLESLNLSELNQQLDSYTFMFLQTLIDNTKAEAKTAFKNLKEDTDFLEWI